MNHAHNWSYQPSPPVINKSRTHTHVQGYARLLCFRGTFTLWFCYNNKHDSQILYFLKRMINRIALNFIKHLKDDHYITIFTTRYFCLIVTITFCYLMCECAYVHTFCIQTLMCKISITFFSSLLNTLCTAKT